MKKYFLVIGIWSLSFIAYAMDPSVTGVDKIKQDIRSALGRYEGLSSWKIYYVGDLSDGEFVNLQMTPLEAFTTVPGQTPREFVVTLKNPRELLTDLGNLKELGVLVHIADNIQGTGLARSVIYVTFHSTGNGQLIPLQKIFHEDRRKLDLTIFPLGKAEFLGFDQEKAYFRIVSGDPASVNVTLRLNDGGRWFTYTCSLASCSQEADTSFTVPTPPVPQVLPRVLTTIKVYRFISTALRNYSLATSVSGEGPTHSAAYEAAKLNAELSLAAKCKEQLNGDLRIFRWAFSRSLCENDIKNISYQGAVSLEPKILSSHYPTENMRVSHGECQNTRYASCGWSTQVSSQATCSYFVPVWIEETMDVTSDRLDFEYLKGLCSEWSVRCIDGLTNQDWIPAIYEDEDR